MFRLGRVLLIVAAIVAAVALISVVQDRAENGGDIGIENIFEPPEPIDTLYALGETVTADRITYTTTQLRKYRTPGPARLNLLCVTVSVGNATGDGINYANTEWSLTPPNGVPLYPTEGYPNAFGAGYLTNGQTVSGDLCFVDPNAGGEYSLTVDPFGFDPKPITWYQNL